MAAADKKKTNNEVQLTEWASKDEAIRTSFPIYFSLALLKCAPKFIVRFAIRCTTLFYYLFSKAARNECLRYQKNYIEHFPDGTLTKPCVTKQIKAFAITFVEKLECWVKKNNDINLEFIDDDIQVLIDQLNEGKGAFLLCSHLGNSEIFRFLANHNKIYLKREVPVSVLMDLGATSNFTNTIKKIAPEFAENIVDVNTINPGTIEVLQDTLDNGGLVVCAGDRVSKYNDKKFVKASFLGKDAPWPYGVYLMTMLLKAPVYYMFGIRKTDTDYEHNYEFHIKKSSVNTDCPRKERETNIEKLCLEFSKELEKECKEHPFQWYNFFDFWKIPEDKKD